MTPSASRRSRSSRLSLMGAIFFGPHHRRGSIRPRMQAPFRALFGQGPVYKFSYQFVEEV
jgi:hypothetical protein